MSLNKELLNVVKRQLEFGKIAYVPPTGSMGMPPGGGMGMPPGVAPPMDSGIPPGMDPAMLSEDIDTSGASEELQKKTTDNLENIKNRLSNLEDKNKIMIDKLDLLLSEVENDVEKLGSDNRKQTLLWSLKQLVES